MSKVINANGYELDFDAAVNLMDDEIREALANSGRDWESDQEFFSAYEIAHEEKFGKEWELSKERPVW